MSKELSYEQELTEALIALCNGWTSVDDARRAVRAYAAEVARGLVAAEKLDDIALSPEESVEIDGHNACRAETLANIERWESSNGQ